MTKYFRRIILLFIVVCFCFSGYWFYTLHREPIFILAPQGPIKTKPRQAERRLIHREQNIYSNLLGEHKKELDRPFKGPALRSYVAIGHFLTKEEIKKASFSLVLMAPKVLENIFLEPKLEKGPEGEAYILASGPLERSKADLICDVLKKKGYVCVVRDFHS